MADETRAITADDIEEANVEPPKDKSQAKKEAAFFDHEAKKQKTNLGWVGAVWGSRQEKPGNIAAIVALIILLFIGWLIHFGMNSDGGFSTVEDAVAVFSSILTLILGYLFGSSSSD